MNSVTHLLRRFEQGSDTVVAPLFERYFERLIQLAAKRLRSLPSERDQDEDVALRSFHSLCRRLRDPDRPLRIANRTDFWWLLATRTISRAIDVARRHRPISSLNDVDLDEVLGRDPTPETAAAIVDECDHLFMRLREPQLRQIAIWKVEGWTNEEIAAKLGCVARTIERKLARIRICWESDRIDPPT